MCAGVELLNGEAATSLVARVGPPRAIASSVAVRLSHNPKLPDSIVVSCCRAFDPASDDVLYVYFCNRSAEIMLDRYLTDPLFANGTTIATIEKLRVGVARVRKGQIVELSLHTGYHIEYNPRSVDGSPCK